MLKYILVLIIANGATSEQMPEWYDTAKACHEAGQKAAKQNEYVDYVCTPVEY